VFWVIASGRCYPLTKVPATLKYPKIDGIPFRGGKHLYGILLETPDFQGNQLYTVKLEPQPYFEPKRPHVLDDYVAGVTSSRFKMAAPLCELTSLFNQ
jgi:hypothetical protein